MNDKKRPLTSLLGDLAGVVNDLYGHNASMLEQLKRDLNNNAPINPELMKTPDVPATGAKKIDPAFMSFPMALGADMMAAARAAAAPAAPQAPAQPQPQKAPALPPFSEMWKTADEPIDWTEMLASAAPAPEDESRQAVFARNAAAVLQGDQAAYLAVLQAANPMADLMHYVTALDVSALSADDMRAVFDAREDLLTNDPRRYLSGMAVRIARDLFAVLPVTRVTVEGRKGDEALLQVEFTRQELHKVRFAFIDPVDFVTRCGGEFTLPEA